MIFVVVQTLTVEFTILLMNVKQKQAKSVRIHTVEVNEWGIFAIANNGFEFFLQF
jgi:preprotein translocase subunit SecB